MIFIKDYYDLCTCAQSLTATLDVPQS
jgi:hypothetical protein